MPLIAVAAGLVALSKAGFPPLFGFLGKESVFAAGIDLGPWSIAILAVVLAGNLLLFAIALKVGIRPFWGNPHLDIARRAPVHGAFGPCGRPR